MPYTTCGDRSDRSEGGNKWSCEVEDEDSITQTKAERDKVAADDGGETASPPAILAESQQY